MSDVAMYAVSAVFFPYSRKMGRRRTPLIRGAQYVAIGINPPVSMSAIERATIIPQKAILLLWRLLLVRFEPAMILFPPARIIEYHYTIPDDCKQLTGVKEKQNLLAYERIRGFVRFAHEMGHYK